MVACYAWLVAGELPSQRLRSYTFGISSAVGFLFSWLVSFTTPYFINPTALNWGPRYGYIWFPASVIAAAWTYFFLPETHGRTLEEINQMVSPSQTPSQLCSSPLTGNASSMQRFLPKNSEHTNAFPKHSCKKNKEETAIYLEVVPAPRKAFYYTMHLIRRGVPYFLFQHSVLFMQAELRQ